MCKPENTTTYCTLTIRKLLTKINQRLNSTIIVTIIMTMLINADDSIHHVWAATLWWGDSVLEITVVEKGVVVLMQVV